MRLTRIACIVAISLVGCGDSSQSENLDGGSFEVGPDSADADPMDDADTVSDSRLAEDMAQVADTRPMLDLAQKMDSLPRVDTAQVADSHPMLDLAKATDVAIPVDLASPLDSPVDLAKKPDVTAPVDHPVKRDGGDTMIPQRVDSGAAIHDTALLPDSDPNQVQAVTLTANQFFGLQAPFLLRADLTRGTDGRFDFAATMQVSLSGCSGDACNQHVSMHLTPGQNTQVETSLKTIPVEACQDDSGPICDFGTTYAIGIDGPPLNQTCCKNTGSGQNADVLALHAYLQGLAIPHLAP